MLVLKDGVVERDVMFSPNGYFFSPCSYIDKY